PTIVGETDLVSDAVEGDDLAESRWIPTDQPKGIACDRHSESLVIGDAVRPNDHLREVGRDRRVYCRTGPHQDVARRRQVTRSQVRADEVTVPDAKLVSVVLHKVVAALT